MLRCLKDGSLPVLRFEPVIRAQYATMPEGLIPVLIMIAVVIIYTVAKVLEYIRKSEQQWREVDKSKLREWDDED